jgi:hypothetical protein
MVDMSIVHHGPSSVRILVCLVKEKFGLINRVPNVSGGLVVSKVPQRTSHSLQYNVKLAQTAEKLGFDFALTQIRFLAGYGADEQHEASRTSSVRHRANMSRVSPSRMPSWRRPNVYRSLLLSFRDHGILL